MGVAMELNDLPGSRNRLGMVLPLAGVKQKDAATSPPYPRRSPPGPPS